MELSDRIPKLIMSQTLTLQISEQVFAAIQRQAAALGIAPESLVATLVEQQFIQKSQRSADAVEKEVARARFERHFGTLELNDDTDVDNTRIDADLAREYAGNHEEV